MDAKKINSLSRMILTILGGFILITTSFFLFSGCASAHLSDDQKEEAIKEGVNIVRERLLFDNCWTAAGATGITDEDARDNIKLGEKLGLQPTTGNPVDLTSIKSYGGAAYLTGTTNGYYHIRYPIDQQFLFRINNDVKRQDSWSITMKVRYKVANKDYERVVVNLNRYPINGQQSSEAITTLMRFDSQDFNASSDFKTEVIHSKSKLVFDFKQYGYFVDAQLINQSSIGRPIALAPGSLGTALGLVQLCESDIIID